MEYVLTYNEIVAEAVATGSKDEYELYYLVKGILAKHIHKTIYVKDENNDLIIDLLTFKIHLKRGKIIALFNPANTRFLFDTTEKDFEAKIEYYMTWCKLIQDICKDITGIKFKVNFELC